MPMAQSLRIRIGAAGICRVTLHLLGPSAVPAAVQNRTKTSLAFGRALYNTCVC